MKKIISLVITLMVSILIFSCASTDQSVDDNPEVVTPETIETEISPAEETETIDSENPENIIEAADETEENLEIISEETEISEKKTSLEDYGYEIPEDFEEPEITELELPEEIIVEEDVTDTEDEETCESETETVEMNIDDIIQETNEDFESEDENSEENLEEDQDSSDDESEEDEENDDESDEEDENFYSDELLEDTENEDEIVEEIVIIPSRSVSLKKGESLEVVYPGSGWIYMGSISEYNNMASKGRKLGAGDTKYTLLAKESGTQIHHFYKVDNITGDYIDDYIEITVIDKKGNSKTIVKAPEYVEIIPKKPELPAKASVETVSEEESEKPEDITIIPEKPKTDTKNQESDIIEQNQESEVIIAEEDIEVIDFSSENDVISVDEDYVSATENTTIDTNELLDNAIILYNEENYEEANLLLIEFFEYSIDRIDEALFLHGQILEADSDVKDIKSSIQCYEAIVKNYPASIYWNDANKRIKYLRRFYYISN